MKYRYLTSTLALLIVLGLLCSKAPAADPIKIGIIDLQTCLNESVEGKKAKKLLEAKNDKLKAKLDAAQAELQKLKDELDKQGMMLSSAAYQDKERDFRKRQRDLQDMVRDFNDEIKEDENMMKMRIFKDLDGILNKVAHAGGFDIVLEKRTTLYSVPSVDITKQILKEYDAQTAKGGK